MSREKTVGHSSETLGPSENASPLLVSQAGNGPDFYPCARHRHALASKALPEYLKIVYQGTDCVFKVPYKDELIDLQF